MQHFFFPSRRFISIGFTDNEFTLIAQQSRNDFGRSLARVDRATPQSTEKEENNLMNFFTL
jgi:hypothetical protein